MERKNLFFWLIAILITLSLSFYQRITGPTRPVKGKIVLAGKSIKYKLIRTYSGSDDAEISIDDPTGELEGIIKYKRFKSKDEWMILKMNHQNNKLVAPIPHQPPAGKIMYQINLTDGTNSINLTPDPVIIRFKGDVPAFIMIPHILFMLLAMIFSTRAGIEAIAKGPVTMKFSLLTTLLLLVGGFIFGPIVQKYAFGEYWTGIPFGWDLTDNKTVVALLFWILAIYKVCKDPKNRGWVLVATLVMTLAFLIPHSLFGSELDYTK